jgi:hypothetical protein
MTAVVVVAILLGFASLLRKRQACLARAAYHAGLQKECLDVVRTHDRMSESFGPGGADIIIMDIPREGDQSPVGQPPPGDPAITNRLRDRARWLAAADRQALLSKKYERAARYPWLPVAPDPAEPD